jgi:hypothetical protein
VRHRGLYFNALEGPIPPSIARLTNLRKLYLYRNKLTGSLPQIPYNKLEVVYLNNNNLTGSITVPMLSQSPLRIFDISRNQLSGALPSTWKYAHQLQQLYARHPHACSTPHRSTPHVLATLTAAHLWQRLVVQQLEWLDERRAVHMHVSMEDQPGLQCLERRYSRVHFVADQPAAVVCVSRMNWSCQRVLQECNPSRFANRILNTNRLQGSIPARIGDLKALQILYESTLPLQHCAAQKVSLQHLTHTRTHTW